MEFSEYINQIVSVYRESLRTRLIFTILLILLGVAFLILVQLKVLSLPEELGIPAKISGLLVSSTSLYPFKLRFDLKRKIRQIQFILSRHDKAEGDEQKKLEEIMWKFIEKNIISDLEL